ncbi:MAG TPA: hypothetical protein VM901_09100 [Bdellovibrionota bacterium]|jgi:hypothetical protein|nr:hypothetical protein [Bdellovibrionota bacterium]
MRWTWIISLPFFATAFAQNVEIPKGLVRVASTYRDESAEGGALRQSGYGFVTEASGVTYVVTPSRLTQGDAPENDFKVTYDHGPVTQTLVVQRRLADNLRDLEVLQVESAPVELPRVVPSGLAASLIQRLRDTSTGEQVHPDVQWFSSGGHLFRRGTVRLEHQSLSFFFEESSEGLVFRKDATRQETISAFRVFDWKTNSFHLLAADTHTLAWFVDHLNTGSEHPLYWFDVNPIATTHQNVASLMWERWEKLATGPASGRTKKFQWRGVEHEFRCTVEGTNSTRTCAIAVAYDAQKQIIDVSIDLHHEVVAFRLNAEGAQVGVAGGYRPVITVRGSKGKEYRVSLEGFLVSSLREADPSTPFASLTAPKQVKFQLKQDSTTYVVE